MLSFLIRADIMKNISWRKRTILSCKILADIFGNLTIFLQDHTRSSTREIIIPAIQNFYVEKNVFFVVLLDCHSFEIS